MGAWVGGGIDCSVFIIRHIISNSIILILILGNDHSTFRPFVSVT